MSITNLRSALVVTGATILLSAAPASAAVFTGTGSGTDGPVAGTADITLGTGTLTVRLTDNTINPNSIGQSLSDIDIVFGNTLGAATLTSQTGQLITINTNGTFTNDPGNPTHWGVSVSGATLFLATAGTGAPGGQPVDLIIGPPGPGGLYSNSNNGMGHITGGFDAHDPQLSGTGTFVISDASILPTSVINSVTLSFGTGPETFVVAHVTPAVPEPSTWAMMMLGFAGLGFLGYYRRSNARFRWV